MERASKMTMDTYVNFLKESGSNIINEKDAKDQFEIVGKSPKELAEHKTEVEYVIAGVTPQEFVEEFGGQEVDFNVLTAGFSKICPDYNEKLSLEKANKSLEFAARVIYTIGPDSRLVKSGSNDKIWKFKFPIVKTSKVEASELEAAITDFETKNPGVAVPSTLYKDTLSWGSVMVVTYKDWRV